MSNPPEQRINARILLYGPKGAGKTTNLEFIHRKLKPNQRGEIQVVESETNEATYEQLSIELGRLKDYETRLEILTVPSEDKARPLSLELMKNASGLIFIVDSEPDKLPRNEESLAILKEQMKQLRIDVANFPILLQFNKRDLPNAIPAERLQPALDIASMGYVEAIASEGHGVRDCFAAISKEAVRRVRLESLGQSYRAPVNTGWLSPTSVATGGGWAMKGVVLALVAVALLAALRTC